MSEEATTATAQLEILRLGSQGDGIAEHRGQPVFVPLALPGETVRATLSGERGELVGIDHTSADRVAPICRHFGRCGGCAMQHLSGDRYATWKRQLVIDAFAQRGIDADVAPLVSVGSGARRRAALSARWTRSGIVLGFHESRGTTIVDLAECPVLTPRLAALLPSLRSLIAVLPRFDDEARVNVLDADNGFSVTIDGAAERKSLDAATVADLANAARNVPRLIRLSIGGDDLYQTAEPEIAMGRATVVPPPNVFLQAAKSAEEAMASLAVAALPKKVARVADLFAGVGAFTFHLAARARVLAVDSDKAALDVLANAARHAQGLKPIETRHRDLFREPLSRKELEGFDAVVLDPPRAGAKTQCEMLAKSKVPLVIAVSCNAATLARDARILIDAGYTLGQVTPIDQFVYSEHVEVVAVLRRAKG